MDELLTSASYGNMLISLPAQVGKLDSERAFAASNLGAFSKTYQQKGKKCVVFFLKTINGHT